MSSQMWALCEAFRKWNGFGDDVIAEVKLFCSCEKKELCLSFFYHSFFLLFCSCSCSFPSPLSSNHPFSHTQHSTHTRHEYAWNAVNDNSLALWPFQLTTPHHHFTRPSHHTYHHTCPLSSFTHTATTAHVTTNNDTQTLRVLQLTHHPSSFLSTLLTSSFTHFVWLTECFCGLQYEWHAGTRRCYEEDTK